MAAPEHEWQTVASFSDVLPDHVLAERLIAEGVPVRMMSDSQLLGEGRSCEVQVPSAIAHWARWLLAAAQFTDEELNYLATGELGTNNEQRAHRFAGCIFAASKYAGRSTSYLKANDSP